MELRKNEQRLRTLLPTPCLPSVPNERPPRCEDLMGSCLQDEVDRLKKINAELVETVERCRAWFEYAPQLQNVSGNEAKAMSRMCGKALLLSRAAQGRKAK